MRTTRIAVTSVLMTALVVLATAGEAVAKKKLGRYYGGTTSEGAPFVLELAGNGKTVKRAVMMAQPDCEDGNWAPVFGEMQFLSAPPEFLGIGEHAVFGRKVSKTGKIRASGLGSEDFGENMAAVSERIAGKVRRNGTASGTLSFDLTIVAKATDEVVTRCSSGELRWTARSKRGQVFAGETDQGLPAVAQLDAARTTVAHLRFGWGASCTPAGALFLPDHLTNFGIADGSFGRTFDEAYPRDGGGTNTYSYTVDGTISGPDASGEIAATLTETDAAGAVIGTCTRSSITWTARSG